MKKTASRKATFPVSRRRWRIPPPLVRDADSPGPEGLSVLQENSGELGLLLWQTLRNVLLWAQVPASSRKRLFSPGSLERRTAFLVSVDPPESLWEPLDNLAAILGSPDRADAALIGVDCMRIHRWAREHGHEAISLEFLQAAALACPGDGRYALAVGRETRDRFLYGRAEAWFQRAIGLCRQARDWEGYTLAYIAYGHMMLRRGSFPQARRHLIKALRRSERQALHESKARACHDLFVVESECEEPVKAQAYARQALESYPRGHQNLPALAHDVGYFWMKRGHFEQALPVLRSALGGLPEHHRSSCLGAIARAGAGIGDESVFETAVESLAGSDGGIGDAAAWLDVAHGALFLSRIEEGEGAALRAIEMAQASRESKVLLQAEGLLQALRLRRPELAPVGAAPPIPVERTRSLPNIESLGRDLVGALQGG